MRNVGQRAENRENYQKSGLKMSANGAHLR